MESEQPPLETGTRREWHAQGKPDLCPGQDKERATRDIPERLVRPQWDEGFRGHRSRGGGCGWVRLSRDRVHRGELEGQYLTRITFAVLEKEGLRGLKIRLKTSVPTEVLGDLSNPHNFL